MSAKPSTLALVDTSDLGAADDRLTEAGAAERFVRLHGQDLRFIHPSGHWMLFPEGHHRWVRDVDAAVSRIALEFVREWQRAAIEIPNRERREAVLKLTMRLERRDALNSMLALASTMKPIADDGIGWDADPWLLGAPNGAIDLHTGHLRPGRREDRITMSTTVVYDPEAACPRWKKFLLEIFGGDEEIVWFVQRAIGYSIVGLTSEQCLFVLYGSGSNGKTTFVVAIKFVLGEYAFNMPFATIELRDRSSIPNDLAALVGRRFVISSETNDGTRLNEARIKSLTGSDPITARFLHKEFFTFEPVGTFWLCVNHRPIIRDDSHGFWRRVRLLPFEQTFASNPGLADQLRAEAPGILSWAVRGCLEWQQRGLAPPAIVTDATAQYARDSDPLADFIETALDKEPESEVWASDLYAHYGDWAKHHGLSDREKMTATMFGRKMSERFPTVRRQGRKIYLDIARRVL